MEKAKKLIKQIINIPKRLFSKISLFSLIIDSDINKKAAILNGCRVYYSKIDKYSYVGRNSVVINAKIGKFTSIANNCNIGLASHNMEWISTSPTFYSGNNCLKKNFANIKYEEYKKTKIGNDVWIGANVLIKSGINIGDGAIIGAGSIVTKDVPPYAIYAGNPAKLIRYRYAENEIKKLIDTKWWDYDEKSLYSLDINTNDINEILEKLNRPKILIQSIYAAPYRVGVFKELLSFCNLDVFFEQLSGHNRNKNFFQNNNGLNFYNLEKNEDYKIYKGKIKNINQYDCVFIYDYSSIPSIKLMLKCLKNNVPYCINCDGYLLPDKYTISFYIKKIIKSFFIKRAARLLANGDSAKQYFLINGAKEEKIDIHYFSSLSKSDIKHKLDTDKKELKKNLGFNDNKLYISVGSFDYRKNFDLIIESANYIDDHKSQYVFIGGGENINLYKKLCNKYQLNNFKFINFLDKEELLKYYDAADAFILPTREDIWGLVINEAMSRGLPIISSNKCNAALEMVTEENGCIVKSESVEELGRAILKFNSLSSEKLMKMGEKSLEISKKYNIEDIASSHIETIKKVLNK